MYCPKCLQKEKLKIYMDEYKNSYMCMRCGHTEPNFKPRDLGAFME